MLSFNEKRRILLSFPEIIEVPISEGRFDFEYIYSKKKRKVIAREFHSSGNGYVYSNNYDLYNVDNRGWGKVKDFSPIDLRLIIMRAIVSMAEESNDHLDTPFYRPIKHPEEWRSFLVDPDSQWKEGYSAKELAFSWQNNTGTFPTEIMQCMEFSYFLNFHQIELLQALPEYKVPLPGGSRPSQNDLFILARGKQGVVSIMVEGKVSEPFGSSLLEWGINSSIGKSKRFRYLCDTLNIPSYVNLSLRYQLFHRAASAVVEAKKYGAKAALMLVHSFSSTNQWFDDYAAFLKLFGLSGELNQIVGYHQIDEVKLYFLWVKGEPKK